MFRNLSPVACRLQVATEGLQVALVRRDAAVDHGRYRRVLLGALAERVVARPVGRSALRAPSLVVPCGMLAQSSDGARRRAEVRVGVDLEVATRQADLRVARAYALLSGNATATASKRANNIARRRVRNPLMARRRGSRGSVMVSPYSNWRSLSAGATPSTCAICTVVEVARELPLRGVPRKASIHHRWHDMVPTASAALTPHPVGLNGYRSIGATGIMEATTSGVARLSRDVPLSLHQSLDNAPSGDTGRATRAVTANRRTPFTVVCVNAWVAPTWHRAGQSRARARIVRGCSPPTDDLHRAARAVTQPPGVSRSRAMSLLERRRTRSRYTV